MLVLKMLVSTYYIFPFQFSDYLLKDQIINLKNFVSYSELCLIWISSFTG